MSGTYRIASVALALLLTDGLARSARCISATKTQCSIASLTGDAPRSTCGPLGRGWRW